MEKKGNILIDEKGKEISIDELNKKVEEDTIEVNRLRREIDRWIKGH